jgi:hypothetical protein
VLVGACALVLMTGPATSEAGEPRLRMSGGTAAESLPDLDGVARLRVRNDLRLDYRFGKGFSLTAAGNLRFGQRLTEPLLLGRPKYAGEGIDEADLYRLAVHYRSADLSADVGRFVRTAWGGFYRVDGIAARFGSSRPVSGEAWFGRVSHPEPLIPDAALGGGAELRLMPPGRGGEGWSGAAIRVGYDFHWSAPELHHRIHGSGSIRDGRGSSVAVGGEFGVASEPGTEAEAELGANAWFRGTATPDARVQISGQVRWQGLSRPNIPESSQHVLETVVPRGYAVADAAVLLRPGPLQLRVSGGPTIFPTVDAARVGGLGKVSADVAVGSGSVGLLAAAASVGGSWYAGGGAAVAGRVGPVRLGGDGGLYHYVTLNGRPGLTGEGRFDVEWTLPVPRSAGLASGDLRVAAHVAGGADRLLAPWLRAGLAIRGNLTAGRTK